MNDIYEATLVPELGTEIVEPTEHVEKEVDHTELAMSVSGMIKYEMIKDILVKPLQIKMVKITREVPVVVDTTKDDGLDINEYQETTKEEIEVPSAFREGIVLKVPAEFDSLSVGDTIVYNGKFAIDFDLFKDSQLVKPYDIVAKLNK